VNGESVNDVAGLSFLSFVYPHGRWAVTAYRQEVANFEASIATQGAFQGSPGVDSRIFPVVADLDLKIVSYGVSGAVRFGKGFSIGAGVSLNDFRLTSTTQRFFVDPNLPDDIPGSFYGPPLTVDANVINFQTQESLPETADHWKVAFNAGISWKIGEKLRVGAVFRQGPDFDLDVLHVAGPLASPPNEVLAAARATFHVPDAYGVGFSLRPTEALTLAVDYHRVQYSQLAKDFTTIFPGSDPANYVADDANQLHVGVEYVFTGMTNPVALRLGVWTDPEHKVRFIGPAGEPDAALFRAGEDEVHASGGIGIVFSGNFQMDLAGDVSSRVKTASLSAVLRF
jgi:long-subunit fatty acid transport protein